jgi:hypothetical protein
VSELLRFIRPYRLNKARVTALVCLAIVLFYAGATVVRIYTRKYYIFLPGYARQSWAAAAQAPVAGPTHVFFLLTDHFEPDWDVEWTRQWADRYEALAARHHDSTGRPPQHTWFYPGEQVSPKILAILQTLTRKGLGEVELHYHHSGDTAETLEPGLRYAIDEFQKFGFLKTVDGRTAFAFIHGNEDLDNADGLYCGVNTELRLLRHLGCFAEFSFPAVYHDSQPTVVNNMYAARDDERPKSYDKPYPLSDLKTGAADLMIFQGPLALALTWNPRRLFVDVDDGNLHAAMPPSPTRVTRWVNANVHVSERPDWRFVKVFAHGASSREDADEVLGPHFDETLTFLEQRYNDGHKYLLHYITAREAYNLAMAAADHLQGDPQQYLDRTIPPYIATAPRPEHIAPVSD